MATNEIQITVKIRKTFWYYILYVIALFSESLSIKYLNVIKDKKLCDIWVDGELCNPVTSKEILKRLNEA